MGYVPGLAGGSSATRDFPRFEASGGLYPLLDPLTPPSVLSTLSLSDPSFDSTKGHNLLLLKLITRAVVALHPLHQKTKP